MIYAPCYVFNIFVELLIETFIYTIGRPSPHKQIGSIWMAPLSSLGKSTRLTSLQATKSCARHVLVIQKMRKNAALATVMLTCLVSISSCTKDEENSSAGRAFPVDGVQRQTILVNGKTFDMVLIEGGTNGNYYIGATEVTQDLYQSIMGTNPSLFKDGSNYPVEALICYNETVGYDTIKVEQNGTVKDSIVPIIVNEARDFCEKLSSLTGKTFRLPTVDEWTYAARGGHRQPVVATKYAGSDNIDEVCWYIGNVNLRTHHSHPVGTKKSNALGIYDMSGNVWEACVDGLCGGGWNSLAEQCEIGGNNAKGTKKDSRSGSVGIRLVMEP